MKVYLLEAPTEKDWLGVKRRALKTVGLKPKTPPSSEWKTDILRARHSPIRRLLFSFEIDDIPYWVSVHLARHVHAQPYIGTQRNDRQNKYDRGKAPQDTPVGMIYDINAEELMVFANKRLCNQASPETQEAVREMCRLAAEACPEIKNFLVPLCEYRGGLCPEMRSCGKCMRG